MNFLRLKIKVSHFHFNTLEKKKKKLQIVCKKHLHCFRNEPSQPAGHL